MVVFFASLLSCKPAPERPAGHLIPYPAQRVSTLLTDSSRMAQWWPARAQNALAWPTPEGGLWQLGALHPFGCAVRISQGASSVNAQAVFLPVNEDSCVVKLVALDSSLSAPQLTLLSAENKRLALLKTYLNSRERLYGFPVQEGTMKDSVLMVSRRVLPQPPGTQQIYQLVETLRRYCQQKGGVVSDSPMVYSQHFSDGWHLQVGLPLVAPVPNGPNISLRNMVLGNRLFATVKGGEGHIAQGFAALEALRQDKDLVSPAIPFQILRSHRLASPDTSQWITELVLPVM